MSCDKLVFDLSQEVEGSPSVFLKKDWINILDNQNGQYASNQSVIDTSQLSNSNKYMSYREAYLMMPMLLTVCSGNASDTGYLPASAGTSSDYAFGLKNWFGQMIHSFTLDYNGTTIIQQTPYINMWNSFKLMTTLSWGDIATIGSTIGFYPDDPLSWTISTTASTAGSGVCNNSNISTAGNPATVSGFHNRFSAGVGNIGFLKRQQYINFDPAGIPIASAGATTYGALQFSDASKTLWKSYILTKQDSVATPAARGVFQIAIQATIYLKHIHSFFQQVPLLKGVFMKMTLNLNNTSVSFTQATAGAVLTLTNVTNSVGGVCPLMIASAVASNGSASTVGGAGNGTAIANISVGATCLDSSISTIGGVTSSSMRNIILYCPAYTFNPSFESAYLSSPIKKIKYTDVYQYQITNIGTNGNINSLITNGIAGIKSVLVMPFYSAGSSNTGLGIANPVWQSPFDPAGTGATSPLCPITNFNVVVSGQNMLYNTQRYLFEEFNHQLLGVNAVNGGLTDGLTSGLIDSLGFDMEYNYYYVDVSRMLPVEESVPKSVQIIGTNLSAKSVDYMVFIEYGCEVDVDVLTGTRV
jgi:hypothetical protein